ncbi:MAG TPA: hypothetical protein VM012_15260, partial [Flavitalea sp.]|nr:hypothetical protein [Flavitalea sp.]
LSSAETPSGLSPLHARQFVSFTAVDSKVCYLHICEGAAQLGERRKETMGKLVSYLVSDFLKASAT